MKTQMRQQLIAILTTLVRGISYCLFLALFLCFAGCAKKGAEEKLAGKSVAEETPQYEVVPDTNSVRGSISDSLFYPAPYSGTVMDKPQLAAFYESPEMKDYYGKRILPPKFDYNMDLSKKTYLELRLLRNGIFARNGYFFQDATLRAYFNRFPWYQPIFDKPDFKLYLNKQEKEFLEKVTQLENEKLGETYTTVGGNKMVSLDHVVNLIQFENINDSLSEALKTKNFALASANNEQLFYVYDNNQYGYIPNFITTDLYLQVLHKYLGGLMQGIEKQKLIPVVADLMERLYDQSKTALTNPGKLGSKKATAWANTYLAISLSALTGNEVAVDPSMRSMYREEVQKVNEASGYGSKFLDRVVFYYSQFKPRGYYTEDDSLERYFRCMKWLNSAPMNLDDDDSFQASLLIAFWIKSNKYCSADFNLLNRVIGMLAGEEDNNSISHLIKFIEDEGIKSTDELLTLSNFESLRRRVKALNVNRIQPKAANDVAKKDFSKQFVLFSAARCTFDAEILIRLVNVLRPALLRPFPKGLDVFAALGHKTAEEILLNHYKENQRWPAYTDSLALLKGEFANYNNWNATIYDKTMDCVNSLNDAANISYPLFMQTDYWQKKNLNTSLAAWTELKHDMILYIEQPYAAEMGEGGGPPPPIQLSYVEPNVRFWSKVIELLDLQQKEMSDLDLMTTESSELNSELKKLAEFLLGISKKELNRKNITDQEFSDMSWIGGQIEQLTFEILGTDHLPEREKQIALAADVYAFNDTSLEEAVGKADEIYVVAEINGLPYLTKGACFSYYEFQSKSRLTDEEWQGMIAEGKTPSRPDWLDDIYVKTNSLRAAPGYSFDDYVSHGERKGYEP